MLEGRDVTAKPDNGARKMPYARRADAWIFLSVAAASADGPATLPDVIGAADMINHEIPLPEEIVGALNRLMFADLVSVNGSQFSLTPEGRATMAERSRPGIGLLNGTSSQADGASCPTHP
jgi:hypothetical protein